MKAIKLISTLLAVLMLMSSFAILASAEVNGNNEPEYTTNTGNGNSLMLKDEKDEKDPYRYKTGEYLAADGTVKVVETAEEKIALMDYRYGTDKYELYVDAYSGEVAIRSKATGETLFTNPYNIGQSKATATSGSTKDEIMSQLIVNYTDIKTDTSGTLYSYTWAAVREQITVMNIKGGIRVEYTMGREESRSLLPRMIEASAWQEIYDTIYKNIETAIAEGKVADPENEWHRLDQFKAFYSRFSLSDAINAEMHDKYCKDYPILEKAEKLAETDPTYKDFAIYVLDEASMGEQMIKKQETLIKEYCPEYTFQDMEEDHAFVEYEAEIENYPLFKMALEYTVEDTGLVVRLPANGIRFNETLYRLDSIEILPYMGAGMNPNPGYTFFPDGSGTLFDFQEIAILGTRQLVSGKVYGQDYAYHEPSGMYEEIIRYPVFGIYEQETLTKVTGTDANGNEIKTEYTKDRGFVAMIEEGDSLMELATSHGGVASEYNTIRMSVFPRPTDSYNIADAISVGSNTEWTVVSSRKYTGSYKVRYIMLTDEDVAKTANEVAAAAGKPTATYYEPSYVGMAKAYRDYLVSNGILIQLTDDKVGEDIPLYIETFGALQTTEKFLSIPINVMTPLTTFEDVQTMYNNLKDSEITNVNFIMKGYTKGGMTSPSVPYNLKWESAVSKEMDFEELTAYAKENDFGLFPDFDFVFASNDTWFDGLTLSKHAAKTIDNRYTSKREYSATKHTYVSYFELALSPAYFSHFYEKFIPKYEKYSPIGISVSTLGSYVNSDFDEDEPYNRADGQNYTEKAFGYIESELENAEIMTAGGNAYSWKYVDHITDIALDSSRFSISSASVPFLGMVLHGYVEIAGTAINEEGNLDYAFLKSVESGAAMKFILSYRNTEKLKEYETLSRYYSVNYDIWYNDGEGDLVKMYHELNALLADVQTSAIIGHEFISGTRVPDDDELMLDAEQAVKDAIEYEKALENATSEAERLEIFEARQLILKGTEAVENALNAVDGLKAKLEALDKVGSSHEFDQLIADAQRALEEYMAMQQFHAIYSDEVDTNNDKYKVSDAIKAYEDWKADETNADKAAAWNKYKAVFGSDYSEKLVTMADAKAAYEKDKTDAKKAAYENAEKALKEATPGAIPNIDKLISAMKDIQDEKDEWVAAYNSGDATRIQTAEVAYKAAYEAAYRQALDSGIVYQITYSGDKDYVGGSRYFRELEKAEFAEATAKLDSGLKALYADATEAMDEAAALKNEYTVEALLNAGKILELDKAAPDGTEPFKGAEYDELKAMYTQLLVDLAEGSEFTDLFDVDVKAITDKAYGMYKEVYDATNLAGTPVDFGTNKPTNDKTKLDIADLDDYEIDGLKADTYLTLINNKFAWTEKTEDAVKTDSVSKPEPNTKKYISDDNKIVHESFDNGKEFLLNFNDYSVVVKLNGKTYTLEAYGYIVIAAAKN